MAANACKCVRVDAGMHVCASVCMRACPCVCLSVCLSVCVHMYTCMHACLHVIVDLSKVGNKRHVLLVHTLRHVEIVIPQQPLERVT